MELSNIINIKKTIKHSKNASKNKTIRYNQSI